MGRLQSQVRSELRSTPWDRAELLEGLRSACLEAEECLLPRSFPASNARPGLAKVKAKAKARPKAAKAKAALPKSKAKG